MGLRRPMFVLSAPLLDIKRALLTLGNMNTRDYAFLFRSLLVALVIASSSGSALRAEEAPSPESLDKQIAVLEEELLRAQAERFRQKHQLEYSDPEAIKLRQEAKTVEKELIDARRAYSDYMLARHENLRTLEDEIAALFRSSAEAQQQAAVIRNEIDLGEKNNADTAGLTEQFEDATVRGKALEQQAVAKTKEFNSTRDAAAAGDPESARLLAAVNDLDTRHRDAFARLNARLDESEVIQSLELKRREMAGQLVDLKKRRAALGAVPAPASAPAP